MQPKGRGLAHLRECTLRASKTKRHHTLPFSGCQEILGTFVKILVQASRGAPQTSDLSLLPFDSMCTASAEWAVSETKTKEDRAEQGRFTWSLIKMICGLVTEFENARITATRSNSRRAGTHCLWLPKTPHSSHVGTVPLVNPAAARGSNSRSVRLGTKL